MRSTFSLLAIAALAGAPAAAAEKPRSLDAECARAHKVYPVLIMAAMMEGPMDCGMSDDGSDHVDCAAGETPEQKAAHARRFETRTLQKNAYEKADGACTAYERDKASPASREAAATAIAEARATDHGLPAQPPAAQPR
jgi:hypothetical protein